MPALESTSTDVSTAPDLHGRDCDQRNEARAALMRRLRLQDAENPPPTPAETERTAAFLKALKASRNKPLPSGPTCISNLLWDRIIAALKRRAKSRKRTIGRSRPATNVNA